MKPSTKNIYWGLLGVIVIGAVVILSYFALRYFVNLISSLDKDIAAAIIASSGTILAAVVTIVISQNRSKKREIAEAHRPNKIETYKQFIAMMVDVMKRSNSDEEFLSDGVLPPDLEEVFFKLQSDMIVWAAPSVIKAYQEFKLNAEGGNILFYLDDTLREIRKDLGHSDSGLKRGDLLKLFLSDPDELDKMIEEE